MTACYCSRNRGPHSAPVDKERAFVKRIQLGLIVHVDHRWHDGDQFLCGEEAGTRDHAGRDNARDGA